MSGSILVVEDEENIAFLLEYNLRAEGFSVTHVDLLAKAAVEIQKDFDLVLLDLMLPDGDGIEFCRALRSRGVLTPVVMLTARDSDAAIVAGLEAGADDYVTKPFVLAQLFSRIRAQLRRRAWARGGSAPQRAVDDVFELNGVRVDFATHLWAGPREGGELTALEVRLIRHFRDNPDRVVSREELLESVWGVATSVQTRTVDNFIVRLRKMFEDDPASPQFLVTVRGAGYRFILPR